MIKIYSYNNHLWFLRVKNQSRPRSWPMANTFDSQNQKCQMYLIKPKIITNYYLVSFGSCRSVVFDYSIDLKFCFRIECLATVDRFLILTYIRLEAGV